MKFNIESRVHMLYELVNISDVVIRKKDIRFLDDERKEFLDQKGYQKEYKLLKDFNLFMRKEVEKNLEAFPLMRKIFTLGGEDRSDILNVLLGYGQDHHVEDLTEEDLLRMLYIIIKAPDLGVADEKDVESLLVEAQKEGKNADFYLKQILESSNKEDQKLLLLEIFQGFDGFYDDFLGYFTALKKAYESKAGDLYPLLSEKAKMAKEDGGHYYLEMLQDHLSPLGDLADSAIELYFSLLMPSSLAAGVSVFGDQKLRFYAGVMLREMEELRLGKKQREKDLLDAFKALGDENRLKVLELVSHKAYYMKELSDELKISPSTLSHHVDVLLQVGLLRFYTKGKRIYLELGTDKINKLATSLTQLAERGTHDLQ